MGTAATIATAASRNVFKAKNVKFELLGKFRGDLSKLWDWFFEIEQSYELVGIIAYYDKVKLAVK